MSMSESGRPVVDGRFELVSRLGSGGMGTVWRARDLALDREVALKEVRPPDPADEQATPGLTAQLRERAVREARALARLSNRHVVTIHHIVEPADGAHPWIVMELVEGRSVHDRLAEGPMPVDEVVRLGLQVLSALRAAHAAGIQHRDVKPANVLLRPDGSAVLTDFGIAAMQDATTRLTSTGDLIGSPEFIAPERIRGEEGNPASDLWSLGMLLYVAAEGRHPLRRATNLATLVAVLDDPLPAPARSGALGPVLARVLQRDPALRPDGPELERLLHDAAGGADATAAAPPTAGQPISGQAPPAAPGGTPPHGSVPPGGAGWPLPHAAYTPTAPVPQPTADTGPYAPTVHADAVKGAFGPPVAPRGERRPRRRAPAVLAAAAVVALAVAGAVYRLPGGDTDSGAQGGSRPGATAATGAPASGASAAPAADTGSSPAAAAPGAPAVRGSLLTTANVRAVLTAFHEASGSAQVTELTVYEDYALASIPTAPGARTYDAYEFRGGAARRTGPGGTISRDSADEQPFDVAALAWDRLPDLMKQAERDLGVDDPTMRYVIVDRWTFNGDEPTMRFYLTNEYRASGYLAADRTGKVVASYPSS
ncbi:serine/threonine-protein kinase [Streptomyces sp. CC77]|uniref:serine/threonine-protein kinase n=1 Tax=Streptomyces sp. CC77 TaxID=1906739 RepID=UPI0008DE1F53|nr:serine/threonine-protein kinase [Streptomyces sp. CC77]OII66946.1 hypothetical protein BJP39_26685 [Streptomyces sp. CC77]